MEFTIIEIKLLATLIIASIGMNVLFASMYLKKDKQIQKLFKSDMDFANQYRDGYKAYFEGKSHVDEPYYENNQDIWQTAWAWARFTSKYSLWKENKDLIYRNPVDADKSEEIARKVLGEN